MLPSWARWAWSRASLIYLPNIAEAVITMLACARVGAIHSVMFGGSAAHNLAVRIDDAQPRLLMTCEAGMRGGRVLSYQPPVDAALGGAPRAARGPRAVLKEVWRPLAGHGRRG